jgi:hypothetical protein
MSYSNGPKIIVDGLVLALDAGNKKSYPGSGTTWNDLSGNAINGTLTNGPTFDSDSLGSIVFDGVNDYVATGDQLDPIAYGLFADASSMFSVSSWFLPDTTNVTTGAITGKSAGVGGSATYVVWEAGTILRTRLRGGTILDITSTLTSTWNEVVITWDGTTANAYLNGSFVNTISVGTAAKQTNTFTIGATASGTGIFYKGNVADTKVYNRALTPDEILQNFNATRSRYGV